MSPVAVRAAAAVLAAARRSGTPLDRLPPDLVPPTIADAYRVQLELHQQLAGERGPRGGWKIGCTTAVMQAYLGISSPSAGTLYARTIAHRDGEFRIGRGRLGVECELAVRLGADLGPDLDGAVDRARHERRVGWVRDLRVRGVEVDGGRRARVRVVVRVDRVDGDRDRVAGDLVGRGAGLAADAAGDRGLAGE